ncbi:MAG: hypothetical protein RLZZ612_2510 [Pseudomonadota bacterium]
MDNLIRHLPRVLVTFLPVILALLHVAGVVRVDVLERIDDIIFDTRLRATMPKTLDERIVVIDIDEKSLAEVGRWPWSRDKLALLVHELFDRQKAAVAGFDIVFAEPDLSSGLHQLQKLAKKEFQDIPEFANAVEALTPTLDHDLLFAQSLSNRPVVLGYYMTSDRDGRTNGQLPQPAIDSSIVQGRKISFTSWNGYGSNISSIANAAPVAGFFNSITDNDGVVRAVPLLAEYKGKYYESLSLAMVRRMIGESRLELGFPPPNFFSRDYQGIESVHIRQDDKTLSLPVDHRVAALVPYRGWGGPQGGSFRYLSATDLLHGRVPAQTLSQKIVLIGTTAPGLLDLRVTPVGSAYPGVEAHANLISGMLDGRMLVKPDYAMGYDLLIVLAAGVLLAITLPLLTAVRAVMLTMLMLAIIIGINFWLYLHAGLVLPLATSFFMIVTAFSLNMSYGYFVESRSKRELVHLFGTYAPPELVDEMAKDPKSYSMEAQTRELTVMFCDMRGFTQLSEGLEPAQLQALLNRLFSRLTQVIRSNHQGTIDKYMGDCVMAFWGAPVPVQDHAARSVAAALEMIVAVGKINQEHRQKGLPEVGVGIGLNTGSMHVGDMGSDIRKAYTVIGDAVNLGSRLEALTRVYGVDIVVSEYTRKKADQFKWLELDRIRVKGKQEAVTIYTPLNAADHTNTIKQEMSIWHQFLKAYRSQNWDACDVLLLNISKISSRKTLHDTYIKRVQELRKLPFDATWDGVYSFDTK